jgi:hypothetical protein
MDVTPAQTLDPLALIEAAPEAEYALLELRLDWPPDLEIYPQHLQLWLRCFVITQDPLSWIPNRGEAWATASADAEVLEVDLYVALDAIKRGLEANGGDLASAVGRFATPVMHAALEHEQLLIAEDYLDLAVAGDAPRLLDDLDRDAGSFGTPSLQVRQPWGAVGLGAITDLVQDAFGRVDLDRSDVKLDPAQPLDDECPACKGLSFRFPGDLETARETMCARHAAQATVINRDRLARAHESNRAGWRAIDKAAMRVNRAPEPSFAPQPPRLVGDAPARNEPCPCGSGKKYKRCHGA